MTRLTVRETAKQYTLAHPVVWVCRCAKCAKYEAQT